MLDVISGIANLRPVFDFLDKSDREEVACVSKAFHTMVRVNSDVFKKVRKLSKKEAMEAFAHEMNPLIHVAFDLSSDREERLTNEEKGCRFNTDTTHYVNFRKLVFPKHEFHPRMIELHIQRFKLVGTHVKREDIWVYEKHINKNKKTGKDTGFIINNLSFVDYSRKYSPSRYFSNYFPKYIKSKFDKDLERRNKKKQVRLIV
jgi:hypothetical protein